MKKQLSLFEKTSGKSDHGSASRAGKRKLARPLATKKPMHLVLRSSRAVGAWSFLRKENRKRIKSLAEGLAQRYGVRVMGFENVGNHLHLIVQGKSRPLLQAFLRTLPAKITFSVTGAKKGNPVGRFFDQILFTRIVEWGRDFARLRHYLFKNKLESEGINEEFVARWRDFAKTVPI